MDADHPCIMSQTIFKLDRYVLNTYTGFGGKNAAGKILEDIKTYLENYDDLNDDFYSFIAVFNGTMDYTEIEFEKLLWKQLQHIHDLDGISWDNTVASDPRDKSFSFSILGTAFYIIGMHPNSSRKARRSPQPSLVFNLHSQFDNLRKMGGYTRVRNTIRRRDLQKNGSINPMLEDFGEKSEAAQYSGRATDTNWVCPFKP